MDVFEKAYGLNIAEKTFSEMFSGYKGYACLALASVAGAVCVVMLLLKKRNIKNYIFVFGIAAVCAGIVLLTNFQSTNSFYGKNETADGAVSVTLSVRCDKIIGREGAYIPADGCIIPETEYYLNEGETVYDVLVRAVRENKIQMECDGAAGDNTLAYVKGINYIYEFDYGELSGWVYHVNGTAPSVGCGAYRLSDGDVIEWIYTLELGNDTGTGVQYEAS